MHIRKVLAKFDYLLYDIYPLRGLSENAQADLALSDYDFYPYMPYYRISRRLHTQIEFPPSLIGDQLRPTSYCIPQLEWINCKGEVTAIIH